MELEMLIVLAAGVLEALTLVAVAAFTCQRLRQPGASAKGMLRRAAKQLLEALRCDSEPGGAERRYHEALCDLLVRAGRGTLLAMFCRFAVLQYRYVMDIPHPTPLTLDLSSLGLYALLLLWSACGRRLITPGTLDAWTTIAFIISCVALVFEKDPGLANVIAHRSFIVRVVCLLTSKHFWLSCCLSFIHWLLVTVRIDNEAFSEERSIQTVQHVTVVLLAYAMRQQLYTNAKMALELKTSVTGLDAASRLLRGFCDAVVELDDSLNLRGDTRQLATMLLHGHGDTPGRESLARDFIDYFSPTDREHVETCLRLDDGNSIPQALHAKMLDSLSNPLEVELLHVRFQQPEGQVCQLVGVREFPDFSAVAPLTSDVESRLRKLHTSANEEAQLAQGQHTPKSGAQKASLLFDAFTFEVLVLDEGMEQMLEAAGRASKAQLMDELTLHQVLPPKEISQLQQAVNVANLQNGQTEIKPVVHFDNFKLANGQVRRISFEFDTLLSSWVGSLFMEQPDDTKVGKCQKKGKEAKSPKPKMEMDDHLDYGDYGHSFPSIFVSPSESSGSRGSRKSGSRRSSRSGSRKSSRKSSRESSTSSRFKMGSIMELKTNNVSL